MNNVQKNEHYRGYSSIVETEINPKTGYGRMTTKNKVIK
jgi:hypothetical protein